MSFASFALDRGVDHLGDEHEHDRDEQRDQLDLRDADGEREHEHHDRDNEVHAHVALGPQDVDQALERVVERVEDRRRASGAHR
jgi:hypothetical protein